MIPLEELSANLGLEGGILILTALPGRARGLTVHVPFATQRLWGKGMGDGYARKLPHVASVELAYETAQ